MIWTASDDATGPGIQLPLCPEICATANRLADLCMACEERLAHSNCDSCERRICRACVVQAPSLPLSSFCATQCRDEAELAAEEARQTDAYARWR